MNWVNSYKIGDCFWSLQYLRRLGGAHRFYCRPEYGDPLRDMLEGTEITMLPLHEHPDDCIDLWIGSGSNAVNWYSEQCPSDLIAFLMKFFNSLGFGEVFTERQQFLADYPSIKLPHEKRDEIPFVLIINANPESSQCPGYSPDEMDVLIDRIGKRNAFVRTNPINFSMKEIGRLSQIAKAIIGVATGPIWTTFNIWNKETPRHILLDGIHLDFGITANVQYHRGVGELMAALEKEGWL